MYAVQVEPSAALDRRILAALVLVLFVMITSLYVVKHQLDVFRQQVAVTNQHLAMIQKQECLDANAAAKAQAFATASKPVYRACP